MKTTFRKRRHHRAWRLLGIGLMLASGIGLATLFLQENLFYYSTPTALLSQPKTTQPVRLGGIVKPNSLRRFPPSLKVQFIITDGTTEIPVHYQGVPPDLFAEGQGVVAEGTLQGERFIASQILAKHDENYSPPV